MHMMLMMITKAKALPMPLPKALDGPPTPEQARVYDKIATEMRIQMIAKLVDIKRQDVLDLQRTTDAKSNGRSPDWMGSTCSCDIKRPRVASSTALSTRSALRRQSRDYNWNWL